MIELPIDSQLPEIIASFKKTQNLVLTASPGAGKTTRLPPALLALTDKKILVLEPRRIAAVAAAQRISHENNWQMGQQVGYQVRFDSKSNQNTRLVFLTEALLTQKILQDPELSDVGIVVLDEFHERSVNADLALGLLKELQELSRPDLKIVIMSATLETTALNEYLQDCTAVHVPGKIFPLETSYAKESQGLQANHQWIEKVSENIRQISVKESIKDLLVFLPGAGEIERVFSQIETWAQQKNFLIYKLHGSMDLSDQSDVLEPQSQKKIILATNIAESSLTINGVNAVLDTGLSKQMSLHAKTGFPQLLVRRISKSSATQRAGRAARQEKGYCFRLWTKMDEMSMLEHDIAEIFRTDLSETLLSLSALGVRDFKSFSWLEKPKDALIERATQQLRALQLIDTNNAVTELGKSALSWPLPLRMSVLMEKSIHAKEPVLGAILAALLSEKDILRNEAQASVYDCDLSHRVDAFLHFMKSGQSQGLQRSACYQVQKSVDQLLKKAKVPERISADKINFDKIPLLILESFSDRLVARRRQNESTGIMAGGRGVQLDQRSLVKKSQFFVALNLVEGLSSADTKVSLACAMPEQLIQTHLYPKATLVTEIDFDEKSQKVIKRSFKSFQGLPLEEARIFPVSNEEAQTQLPQVALARWQILSEKNENLSRWLERYHFLRSHDESLPDFSDAVLLKEILSEACMGETKLENLYSKDLIYFFESKLSSLQKSQLDKQVPSQIQVPSGSSIKVHYTKNGNPHMEVRLQEVFGWFDTPKILNGSVAVTLHLLGPNYRPVQVTQDLKSFWGNGYNEVRKELKARYPKHSWPEDPTTAPAVAKGRPTKR